MKAGESDLRISYAFADGEGDEERVRIIAERILAEERSSLEAWAKSHPVFLSSLDPLPDDPAAPPLVRTMLRAGLAASVGPMASVAGAIAEAVGRGIAEAFPIEEIVVENGGDLWLSIKKPLLIAVYAGLSSLSLKVAVRIGPELSPCGVATSSGTVGPSLSYGKADAALAISADGATADAWATALGNRCRSWAQAEESVRELVSPSRPELRGALVVMADKLAAAGTVRLAPLQKNRASH